MAATVCAGSLCAPPSGSGMTSSTILNSARFWAFSRSASAAAAGGARVLPKDGGAALGGDDRVVAVFEDQHAVGHADAQRAAGAALADDDRDRRDVLSMAISRRLTAMASATWRSSAPMPGKAPGVSMKADDGQPEFLRHLHQAQRLAVALGCGMPKLREIFSLVSRPFCWADQHHRLAVEERRAADQRQVIVKMAVAVQLLEAFEDGVDVVEGVRPVGMAGDLHPLPGVRLE